MWPIVSLDRCIGQLEADRPRFGALGLEAVSEFFRISWDQPFLRWASRVRR
jgi:hypothetical protein